MRKVKNIILKGITVLAFIVFVTSVACVDSEYNTPFYIAMFVSLGWLYLFAIANDRCEKSKGGKS